MGVLCSKCHHVSSVEPINISFDQDSQPTNITTISNSKRFLENCLVIWPIDESTNKYEKEKDQLRRNVYELQIFTEFNTCINYIKNIQDEKIFLITSIKYQSIEEFSRLTQIEKIYIFDSSSSQKNIFSDINILNQQLQHDMELCELDLIHFSTILNSTKEGLSFIFTQILSEMTSRYKFDNGVKDVWINFCRIHYSNNLEQLQIIDEFAKQYRPNTALDWLKRSCFISKILNRTERTREFDIRNKILFFIKHLNTQLILLHEQKQFLMKNISKVYRGKTLTKIEFDLLLKNHSNGLLSFSNYLLATINKQNIIDFLHHRLAIHPDRTGIIFEIYTDQTIFNEERPYALLKDNNEICFSGGTVFRIESIEQTNEDSLLIHLIKLKLMSIDDPQLQQLVKPFRTNDMVENPLSCLGKLLMDMGEYRRVEQFCLELLNDSSVNNQPRRLTLVHIGLGANYMHKCEYTSALEHYQKALQASLSYLSEDHPDLACMYKDIGDCYLKQEKYRYALENYERAIHLIKNQSTKSQLIIDLHNLVNKTKEFIKNNK